MKKFMITLLIAAIIGSLGFLAHMINFIDIIKKMHGN